MLDIVKQQLDPNHYDALKGLSMLHALVYLQHSIYTETNKLEPYCQLLLLDYTKAFDYMDHNLMTAKMRRIGVPDFLVECTTTFLHNQTQHP